ncbi:MAG: hypothetical protein DCF30_04590 [Hyphomicrobiales bacterium]|nr:MAG: hypothetical protein DCF30_04590 [Hyphomicrobiales bacterium]
MNKPLAGRRILLVEDEMMLVELIESLLYDLGSQSVSTAATVRQGLDLIGRQVFDAAMLDVNLSGETSFAVADALAARGIPFLFSTGYGIDGLTERFRDRPVLRKPFQYEELSDMLESLLA